MNSAMPKKKKEKNQWKEKILSCFDSFFSSEGLYKPFIIIDIIMLPVICPVILIPVTSY